MRFLGLRNADGTEWSLSPIQTLIDCPHLWFGGDGIEPMKIIADFEIDSEDLETAWPEAKLIWAEVQEFFWSMSIRN